MSEKLNIPTLILSSLLSNEEYRKRIFPYIKYDYFESPEDKHIVKYLKIIYSKYSLIPKIQIVKAIFNSKVKINDEEVLKNIEKRLDELNELEIEKGESLDYLIDVTEDFFVKRDLYLNLTKCVDILQGDRDKYDNVLTLIQDSLNISLKEKDLGYVYSSDNAIRKQYEYYNETKIRYSTHLENFNKLIGSGFERKTLNIFIGEPGIGKSRFLTDLSLHFIKEGLNVLYISLELSENKIYQRVDANLFDININSLEKIDKSVYFKRIKDIKDVIKGKLIIKEYPAESISINDIERLIDDIKNKLDINIDILVVDYLTVMKTAKNIGMNVGNLYVNGKIISSELHSIATKYNLILLSALHLNRPGWGNIDVKMGNIAESAGIFHAADFGAALVATESMRKKRRMVIKILKNRLYSISEGFRLIVGVDDFRMKHFDVDDDINEKVDYDVNIDDFKL